MSLKDLWPVITALALLIALAWQDHQRIERLAGEYTDKVRWEQRVNDRLERIEEKLSVCCRRTP